jgi:VWFA-related protein
VSLNNAKKKGAMMRFLCFAWLLCLPSSAWALDFAGGEDSGATSITMSPLYLGSFPKVGFFAKIQQRGQVSPTIQKEDFFLFEDDVKIDDFSLVLQSEPAEVAMILDSSGSVKDFAGFIRQGAKSFFEQLYPQDSARIITFNNHVRVASPMTSDRAILAQAIDEIQVYGGTKLYDGVYKGLEGLDQGRRFAVVFTDGQDMKFPTDSTRFSTHSLEDVISLSRHKNIPIFGIGVGSSIDARVMEELCFLSGGKFFQSIDPGALPAIYKEISLWIRNRYLIAYSTPNREKNGFWHKVILKHKGSQERDQKRYRIPVSTQNMTRNSQKSSSVDGLEFEAVGDFLTLNLFEGTGVTIPGKGMGLGSSGMALHRRNGSLQVGSSMGFQFGNFAGISGVGQSVVIDGNQGLRINTGQGASRLRVNSTGGVLIDGPSGILRVSSEGVLIDLKAENSGNPAILRSVQGGLFTQYSNLVISNQDQRVYVKIGKFAGGQSSKIPRHTVAFADGSLYSPITVTSSKTGASSVEIPGITRVFQSDFAQTVLIPGAVKVHQGKRQQAVEVPGVRILQGKDGQSVNLGGISIETGKGGIKVKIPGLIDLDLGGNDESDEDDEEEDEDQDLDDDDAEWNVFD